MPVVISAATIRAEASALASAEDVETLVFAGGVAANTGLRTALGNFCDEYCIRFLPVDVSLCGDNAAMIGAQGYYEYLAGNTAGMELNAYATKSILGESL